MVRTETVVLRLADDLKSIESRILALETTHVKLREAERERDNAIKELENIKGRVWKLEQKQEFNRGKSHVTSGIISLVVAAAVTAIIKYIA